MVLGEQTGGWLLAKKIQATNVASAYVLTEPKDQPQGPHLQSVISAVHRRARQCGVGFGTGFESAVGAWALLAFGAAAGVI